jgi:hypothetical protein
VPVGVDCPSVWDETSELFLCPFHVAEGEDDGVPASGVHIDDVLADVGDELLYVCDYGDDWELRIRLESVVDRAPGAVRAVCTGGRRGAPPENCGGIYAYDDAVTEPGVEQADAFDADAVNEVLEATQRLCASVSDLPDLLVTCCTVRSAGPAVRRRHLRGAYGGDEQPRRRALPGGTRCAVGHPRHGGWWEGWAREALATREPVSVQLAVSRHLSPHCSRVLMRLQAPPW